ncbi:MAG: hypothetical protein COA62_00260 [Rhodobiaceae bacterium]|nr:MAG: hypothetical protein COA62_00260 [Rhodobiaceae bacterium]
MLMRFSNWLERISTGATLVLSLGLYVLFGFGVMPNLGHFIPALPEALGPLDLMFAYTPAEAFERIAAYGPDGRLAYALVSLTVDVIYPIIYTVAFGVLITVLARHVFASGSAALRLNLLPVGIFVFDMCENVSVVTLLMIYPTQPIGLALAASAFTTVKWIFAGTTIFCVLALSLAARVRARRSSSPR